MNYYSKLKIFIYNDRCVLCLILILKKYISVDFKDFNISSYNEQIKNIQSTIY